MDDEREQCEILKRYLKRYFYAKKRKEQLESRLEVFKNDIIGVKGLQYSDMPKSSTNINKNEPEAAVLKQDEIKEQIDRQRKRMLEVMMEITEVTEILPFDAMERAIIEYRHIDCLSWKEVCEKMNLSRTPCTKYYRKGIEKLVKDQRVKTILEKYIQKIQKRGN